MTGDQLYDRTKQILQQHAHPQSCYYAAKLTIHAWLMDQETVTIWKWKKAS